MANVDAVGLLNQPQIAGGYGNKDVLSSQMTIAAEVQIADVIRPLFISPDFRMDDLLLVFEGANAGATISVGYASVDGLDVDADYFIAAGTSVATSVQLRKTAATLPKAIRGQGAYLTITVGGAVIAADTIIAAVLDGKYLGAA